MASDWTRLALLCYLAALGCALPARSMEDVKKADPTMKPKPKRAQEMLMFGNQQNRQAEAGNNLYTSMAEKRTLGSSGLTGLKSALGEDDKYPHVKSPSNNLYDRNTASPYERNYEYGKVLVNELNDDGPRAWDAPSYARYYMGEDRRKRSEKSPAATRSTTISPSTTSYQVPMPTQQPVQAQVKRSVPVYATPRFKRNLDPEDVLTILSLWENERRNGNWHKYGNDEYDNIDDDSSLMDDEDPANAMPWADGPIYPTHRYGADSLSPSEIGIVRTHPPSYYEQYGGQYGSQYGNQYDPSAQYESAQYNSPYAQHAYYPAEKRFMVTRKRSQAYDPYLNGAQLQMSSQARGYPAYQRRVFY